MELILYSLTNLQASISPISKPIIVFDNLNMVIQNNESNDNHNYVKILSSKTQFNTKFSFNNAYILSTYFNIEINICAFLSNEIILLIYDSLSKCLIGTITIPLNKLISSNNEEINKLLIITHKKLNKFIRKGNKESSDYYQNDKKTDIKNNVNDQSLEQNFELDNEEKEPMIKNAYDKTTNGVEKDQLNDEIVIKPKYNKNYICPFIKSNEKFEIEDEINSPNLNDYYLIGNNHNRH